MGFILRCYRVNKNPHAEANGSPPAGSVLVMAFGGERRQSILAEVPTRHVREGRSRGGGHFSDIRSMEGVA